MNTPLIPDSQEEWALETEIFNFINNKAACTKEEANALVGKLWAEIVEREKWWHAIQELKKQANIASWEAEKNRLEALDRSYGEWK